MKKVMAADAQKTTEDKYSPSKEENPIGVEKKLDRLIELIEKEIALLERQIELVEKF